MTFKIYVTLKCFRAMIMSPGAEFIQEDMKYRKPWWIWNAGKDASGI
jgi:hypothetical protein